MDVVRGEFVPRESDATEPLERTIGPGAAVFLSRGNEQSRGPNEDAFGAFGIDGDNAVLALADGAGGAPAGQDASRTAVRELLASVARAAAEGTSIRDSILAGFENANRSLLDRSAGSITTMSVVLVESATVRFVHVGDSEILLTGQRGRLRWKTISHSPVAYAIEAGLLGEDEAMHHDERHVVSSFVGTNEMRIEVGPAIEMRPRDTLVLGSDGLFDNLRVEEIIECVRRGPLRAAAVQLLDECQSRMNEAPDGAPSKPDDLTFILFRRRRG